MESTPRDATFVFNPFGSAVVAPHAGLALQTSQKESTMFHKHRIWKVTEAKDAATLARDLTSLGFPLCTGFRLGGYLFLNDSLSEDGAQEYCVVKERTGKTVESITMSWCDTEQAETYIRDAVSGQYDQLA